MYRSTHSLTALDAGEWSDSRPARFTPRERAPVTYWIGSWTGPRAGLDAVVKRKIPRPRREPNTINNALRYCPHISSNDTEIGAVIAQSVLRWATSWTIGILRSYSRRGLRNFLFTTASRTALRPTQPPTQGVTGALSPGVKRAGREAEHSLPSSVEVKNAWSYTSIPPIRLHGVVFS
jgi:hypothetical protein